MSPNTGRIQRIVYADCKTLNDVINASCMTRIRKKHHPFVAAKLNKATKISRIKEMFESGRGFCWSDINNRDM